MKLRIGMFALLAVLLSSCSAVQNLSDDDLAKDLNLGARKALEYGVKLAFDKYPDKKAAIEKELVTTSLIIHTNILPSFVSPTGEVLASAAKSALTLVNSKVLNDQLKATIVAALDLLGGYVTLPENPLSKLDPRTTKALIGLFTGIADGINAGLTAPH